MRDCWLLAVRLIALLPLVCAARGSVRQLLYFVVCTCLRIDRRNVTDFIVPSALLVWITKTNFRVLIVSFYVYGT
jgi:hypothetical protein